jgi:hypothetical protein
MSRRAAPQPRQAAAPRDRIWARAEPQSAEVDKEQGRKAQEGAKAGRPRAEEAKAGRPRAEGAKAGRQAWRTSRLEVEAAPAQAS